MRSFQTTRRVIRVACLAGAGVLAIVTAASATVSTPTLPPTPNFAGVASASGLLEHLDSSPGQFPVYEPFYVDFAEGDSVYAGQSLLGHASPYYPGPTFSGLSALLCTAGASPACGLPEYPLNAVANQQTPDSSVGFTPDAGPTSGVGVGALSGEAHATLAGVHTRSDVVALDEPPGSAGAIARFKHQLEALTGRPASEASNALLHIGGIHTETSQHFDSKGVLTVTATVQDTDVSLAGGAIHIGAISATSTSTSNGATVRTHVDDAALNDVTVGGLAATIDGNGITVSGTNVVPGSAIAAINAGLQQALSGLGLDVHFVGRTPTRAVLQTRTCTNGEADGLEVHVSHDLGALPSVGAVYYSDFSLGAACSTVSVAGESLSANLPPVSIAPFSPDNTPAIGTGTAATNSAPPRLSTSPTQASAPTEAVTPPPVAPSRAIALGPTRIAAHPLEGELGTHLVADRLTLLYVIFGLAMVGVLLGAKPLTRSRLPRGGSRP